MLQLLSLFLLSLLSVQQFYPYLTIHLVQTSSNICQSVRTSRRWPGHNSLKPIPAQSYRTRLMPKADCPLPPPPRTLLQLNRTTLFCWKSYCFDNHYHSNAPTLPTITPPTTILTMTVFNDSNRNFRGKKKERETALFSPIFFQRTMLALIA